MLIESLISTPSCSNICCILYFEAKFSGMGRKEVHTLRRKDLNKEKTLEFILLVYSTFNSL